MQIETKVIKKSTYDLSKIKNNQFVLHHHLGLGDHIICNGLVNYISRDFEIIYLPVKEKNFKNIEYLYKENSVISLFQIEDEEMDIKKFSKAHNLQILKIGFKKRGKPFNSGFYKQLNLPYNYSVDFFSLPKNIKFEEKLTNYMKSNFEVKGDYVLVHNESSLGTIDLKISSNLKPIYVQKKLDIYKNIFLYRNLIENATEVHCIDSSFIHLVERVNTKGNLFYHNIKNINTKGADIKLIKNWEIIEY